MGNYEKKSGRKLWIYVLLTVLAALVLYLAVPSNHYIVKALINQLAKIDQYEIFENRVIKAGNPQPWQFAPGYDQLTFPEKYSQTSQELKTVAFLVIQHDSIIFEQYYDGYDEKSHSNSFSMAKCVLSLLVGAAIDDGYIQSVEQPVSNFLPEWVAYGKDTLTIKHLLTMSAGVDWDESYSSLFSKTTKAYYGNDLWELAQTQKIIEKPGVRFNYQSGVSLLIAYLLQKATGKTVSEYASEKLWTPMGAEHDALWSLDKKDGMEKAYCCFNSNARDFARLGQLVLNQGNWNGKQLIDSAYINAAIAPATWLTYTPKPTEDGQTYEPRPCSFYGYQFWIARYQNMTIPFFRGILGQYIFVLPEYDAVVVRLGKDRSKTYNIDQNHTIDVETWINAGVEILKAKSSE
jgi:CubicO group peptidase (beta-lactamase class C family)